jgi:hypothetical protein
MVNGQILIDKESATTLDEADVAAKARNWQEKIQGQ